MQSRTPKEVKQIIKNCLRIEKEGGDVLGYLASEHYISPWATWHNFQKYDLRRTVIMDGKPIGGRPEKYGKRELIEEILQNRKNGISERQTLHDKGYKNEKAKYQQLVEWAMLNDTELYLQMTDDTPEAEGFREDPQEPEAAAPVVVEPEETEQEASDTETEVLEMDNNESVHNYHETEQNYYETVQNYHENEQNDRVIEQKPLMNVPSGLEIVSVKGQAGIWTKAGNYIALGEDEHSIDMWKRIHQDLGAVLQLFGGSDEQ